MSKRRLRIAQGIKSMVQSRENSSPNKYVHPIAEKAGSGWRSCSPK